MPFLLKNIDRAIEWVIRDEMIRRGVWPAQRSFSDKSAFQAALASMSPKVDVFGVGNYTDREQLKENNVIITRSTPTAGESGFAYPYRFELQQNKTYDKIRGAEGSVNIEYEVRFVAFNVEMDRLINEAMIKCLSNRKFVPGMNDDLTNMDESFLITRIGDPVDLSGKDFIERVFRYLVTDVVINEDETVETGIQPIKSIDLLLNTVPAGSDVLYPDEENDVATVSVNVRDYFLGETENLSGWKKLITARLYAQGSQSMALKDLILSSNDAVNTGLSFTAYKGFNRTAAGQFINTKFQLSDLGLSALTNHCYMVFVTDVPASGIMELFGINGFYLRNDSGSGIQTKDSDTELQLTVKVKSNTLYTLNRLDRNKVSVFEGEKIIGVLEEQPAAVPSGNIFDLNIGDNAGVPVGVAVSGGIGFSAAGPALQGREIKELNAVIRAFMSRVGVIPAQ